MGVIEGIFEHASIKSGLTVVIGAWIVWAIISRINEHIRITRLGSYARPIKSSAPFGLDVMVRGIRATMARKNLNLWRDDYFGDATNCFTAELRVLNQRVLLTGDPENIKAILATQFSDYGKGEPFHRQWEDFLGDSIFATDGAKWHDSRQLIRPQFTRDRVSDLHCFESHMSLLFKAMDNGGPLNGEDQVVDQNGRNGKVIDMSDLFFRYTLDVTTDFLLGADVKSLSTPKQDFADAFNDVQRIQVLLARTAKLRYLIPKRRYWKGLETMNNFINRFIERALRLSPEELAKQTKSDKGYSFLHELAKYTRDPKVLRDQIVAVLLAGRDTTAGTLSWAIYELSRHPEAAAKLRREIIDTLGTNQQPTYEDMKNMPYLKAVINETLRLYPSVPFNVRLALKDTTLPFGGGKDGKEPIGILKDTPVGYSTLLMQRRADLYPPISENFADPAVFSPERWNHWHPRPHDYIPFNAGPRICIGQQFALTEMSYVLCRLFQRYDRVTSHMYEKDGGDPELQTDITVSPGQGVYVAFWKPEDA